MVRCAACGAKWRAQVERALELTVSSEEGALAVEEDFEPQVEEEDFFQRPVSELAGEDLPKAFRARAQAERRVREAAAQGVIWAGMGAAVALMLVVAIVFRVDIVQVWPRSASAYASIGLPVNGSGLSIEDVHAQPTLVDGRAVLQISGVVRSIRAKPVIAPAIALLDKSQKRVLARTALPGDRVVRPGETRRFTIRMFDPPRSDVWVTFDGAPGALPAPSRVAQQEAPPGPSAAAPPLRPTPSAIDGALPATPAGGTSPTT